jgi:large subunit ribosomal protein L5
MNNQLAKLRFKEYYKNIVQLDTLTKFNYINTHQQSNIKKIILNFSFKPVNFNKKRLIPFFMALELISGQKCSITRSRKLTMALKIRKGSIVGCKVTLQKNQLYQFYDYLLLALTRSENLQPFSEKAFNNKQHTFSFSLQDLFNFYQVELDLNPVIQTVDVVMIYNTKNTAEKIFLSSAYKLPINIKSE